ncbi:hypothetical protein FSP39_012161 [Pinctada imbricata]|uniref:Ig-like domain-containing protein n=1 Tax=Pinctada imbricata TaxID=66713 RepID=A0AA89BZM3_PINIB|nr:hypothetical protein FSP39_012161 [Pinctada imbricata]
MEEGENFDQISCSAQCNPVCVIQWKFNGDGTDSKFEDFGNQRNRLLLQYVTRDMAGTYRCVAHNKYGSKKKDVSLNVQYGPNVVSTSPTNQSMIAQEGQSFGPILCTAECNPGCEYKWRFIPMGDKIAPPFNGPNAVDVRPKKQMFVMKEGESFDKISCSAQCNPECVIQWKFNSNGTNSTFEDFGNQGNRLLLDNVTRDMAGTYRCVAQNKYGSTKKDVSLNVQYGPNVVSTSPTNQSMIAQEGQSFGPILCTAECNPGCEYKWRFIPMGDKIAPPFNGPNAVDVRPKKQMFVMKEGASFDQISCSAQCNPECVIQWKFNSNGTNATFEDFGSQGNILLLDNVTRDMAGTYRCVAQNKYGSKKKDVSLNVQYGPNLVSLSPTYQSVSVQEGQSFGPIICEAECNPHCEFNWTLKNTVDDASLYFNIPNNYLHIVYVTRNMAGIYRCVAKNQISFNDVQISLNILCEYDYFLLIILQMSKCKTEYFLL